MLDRLVGYKLSPLLWKKVKRGLSAGRVQTVALRIVVEREREIEAFVPVEYWTIEADLAKQTGGRTEAAGDVPGRAAARSRGEKAELDNEEQDDGGRGRRSTAPAIACATSRRSETQRRPAAAVHHQHPAAGGVAQARLRRAPHDADSPRSSTRASISVPQGTQGLITYMRTDSTNVAASAQDAAREVIAPAFRAGVRAGQAAGLHAQGKGAQEAHEAIRPTSPHRDPASVKPFLSPQQFQALPADLAALRRLADAAGHPRSDRSRHRGRAPGTRSPDAAKAPFMFRATGSVIKFPGFMAVYQAGRDEGDAADELEKDALPQLRPGEELDLLQLLPEQHFTQPPPRFTEASLVKALEEQGIGRPSTYAPTVATLQARGYVATEQRKLMADRAGAIVNDLLVEHFPRVFDVGFTSQMEEELDEIASGDRSWVPTLHEFYGPFVETLNRAEQTMERVRLKDEPAGEDCENCGRPMVIKLGKFGKFMACSGFPECRNARPLADEDRRDLPDLRRRRGRGAALEEGPHLLWLRALPGLRLRLLEQAGRARPARVAATPTWSRLESAAQVKCPACGIDGRRKWRWSWPRQDRQSASCYNLLRQTCMSPRCTDLAVQRITHLHRTYHHMTRHNGRYSARPYREPIHGTTILGVRRDGIVAMAGDGQVTFGDVVLKHGARKIRPLHDGAVLAGFAGAVADALTLFAKFETQLKSADGNLRKAAVELAKEWRTDRYLRRLEAQLIVADGESILVLSGEGDVIEPDDGIAAIGSGAPYATAAAKALLTHTDLSAREIVESAMRDRRRALHLHQRPLHDRNGLGGDRRWRR